MEWDARMDVERLWSVLTVCFSAVCSPRILAIPIVNLVPRIPAEVAWCLQFSWHLRMMVFKQIVRHPRPPLHSTLVKLLRPKIGANTLAALVLARSRLLQGPQGYLASLLVAPGAISRTSRVFAPAPQRHGVPNTVRCRCITDRERIVVPKVVATQHMTIFVKLSATIVTASALVVRETSASALAPVVCETHSEIHVLLINFFGRSVSHSIALDDVDVELAGTARPCCVFCNDLVHQVPHDPIHVG
mmetsp:Transcript_86914/g.181898  ORF Transcript_86914/g.181898 Transcript_86914/m.181898 type:complete len:246 (-) Transcript_86914:1311-2048(-)